MRYSSLLVLIGCGWSEARFEAEGIDRLCEAAAACAGTYDAATCVDRLRTGDRSGCGYDRAAAADCAEQLEGAQCVPVDPFDLDELAIPEPCYAVWDCDWLELSAF